MKQTLSESYGEDSLSGDGVEMRMRVQATLKLEKAIPFSHEMEIIQLKLRDQARYDRLLQSLVTGHVVSRMYVKAVLHKSRSCTKTHSEIDWVLIRGYDPSPGTNRPFSRFFTPVWVPELAFSLDQRFPSEGLETCVTQLDIPQYPIMVKTTNPTISTTFIYAHTRHDSILLAPPFPHLSFI
ncbi:hypothetical protein YC2023_076748 [Brassica napus]